MTTLKADLYRLVSPENVCPFGVEAKALLESRGYAIADHHFKSKLEMQAFMRDRGVESTPQVYIDAERIGGYEDLARRLGVTPKSIEKHG